MRGRTSINYEPMISRPLFGENAKAINIVAKTDNAPCLSVTRVGHFCVSSPTICKTDGTKQEVKKPRIFRFEEMCVGAVKDLLGCLNNRSTGDIRKEMVRVERSLEDCCH
ncbi:hypothetical protein RIF29_35414 [Crotalaria pallida]|uniref:Uncharacterized protein n=1 Tax=Crotalaria pallida TaxID=3830 RepID=A0AAN9EA96_CROPI